ncbi:hypothetical protein ACTVL4_18750 [Serratia nevei]|uniref:hypothetical protein n=1 Tax=Serratia nevei TaxID=2703794 RepID=UPI003FA776F7
MDANEMSDLKEDIFVTQLLLGAIIKIIDNRIGIDLKEMVHQSVEKNFAGLEFKDDATVERIKKKIKEI